MQRRQMLLGAGALGIVGQAGCQTADHDLRPSQKGSEMTENEKIVRDFIAAWSGLNVDVIVSYFAEDGIYHNMPTQPVKGRAALRQFIATFLKPWTKTEWDILTIVSQGDIVVAERLDRTVAMGKNIDLPCCGVFEMQNGKISVWRDYFDMATYTKALQS